MRLRTLILIALLSTCAIAQQTNTAGGPPVTAAGPNPLVTLASEFFEHDYVNIYAYGDGVVDTNNPILTNSGQVRNSLGTGFDVGGGLSLVHTFKDGQLTFSYQGGYRDYQSSFYSSGTTQALSLGYVKRMNRHLSMSISASGGTFLYGGAFLPNTTAGEITPVAGNPFSPETKYVSASISLTYQQTRRLSYTVYGNFFLARYNYPGGIGTTGASGGASVNYRLTARDTLSGVYSHSYYSYQLGAGNASADQIGLNFSHQFNNHWNVSLFGGGARSFATGTIALPVNFLVGNEAVGGYVLGQYKQTAYLPSFSASVSHSYRRSVLSASAGEGIASSGNGYFLASRSIYFNGVYSYSLRNQNISAGASVYRLSSVANAVSNSYSSIAFSASYGRTLIRFVGMFLRYDYAHYGALQPYAGIADNRFTFGFNFSSQTVPLTLF